MSKKSVYLIYGTDEYLVSGKAREIVKKLVPDGAEMMGLDIIDGSVDNVEQALAAIDKCITSLQSLGLFADERVVWLKGVNFLYDSRTGKSAAVGEALGRLADLIKDGIPSGIEFVISSDKCDKRKAFFKACKAQGELHEFMVPEKAHQADKAAGAFLADKLADTGLRMSSSAKALFLGKVGANTRLIVNELEKLALYIGDKTSIDDADVEAVVSSAREAVAWDLADAFGKRDLARALAVLRQLVFQKESTMGLVMGLERRIRELLLYRESIEAGWLSIGSGSVTWNKGDPAAGALFEEYMATDPRKIHPYRAFLLAQQAKSFSRTQLRRCLREVCTAHERLVSSRVPQEMTLELLLVRMLG
jgi:DNA polymerase-3 subunit delta